jgi:hypothetical protein
LALDGFGRLTLGGFGHLFLDRIGGHALQIARHGDCGRQYQTGAQRRQDGILFHRYDSLKRVVRYQSGTGNSSARVRTGTSPIEYSPHLLCGF